MRSEIELGMDITDIIRDISGLYSRASKYGKIEYVTVIMNLMMLFPVKTKKTQEYIDVWKNRDDAFDYDLFIKNLLCYVSSFIMYRESDDGIGVRGGK
jgi:hypothetical protein